MLIQHWTAHPNTSGNTGDANFQPLNQLLYSVSNKGLYEVVNGKKSCLGSADYVSISADTRHPSPAEFTNKENQYASDKFSTFCVELKIKLTEVIHLLYF